MDVGECLICFNRDDKARLDPGVAVYFSKNAKVYCHSGYYGEEYKTAIRNDKKGILTK